MAAALVQKAVATAASGTSLPITLSAPTNGNTIVLTLSSNAGFAVSVVESGVTWTMRERSGSHTPTEVWDGVVGAGASGSIAVTTASGASAGEAREYSGIAAFDTGVALSGSSVSPSAGPTTPTATGGLAVSAFSATVTTSGGPTNSYANTADSPVSATLRLYTADLTSGLVSGVATSTTWTIASTGWDAVIGTWKPAAASTSLPAVTTWKNHYFAGTFVPENLQIEYDSSAIINSYIVRGAAANYGPFYNRASILKYGLVQAYYDAPNADTANKGLSAGTMVLAQTSFPAARGSFEVHEPIDGWLPGQWLFVVSPMLNGGVGQAFKITKITRSYYDGKGHRHYLIEFGGNLMNAAAVLQGPAGRPTGTN